MEGTEHKRGSTKPSTPLEKPEKPVDEEGQSDDCAEFIK